MLQTNLQVLFSVVLISIFAYASSSAIEIRLPQGSIYGNLVNNESGRKYVEFIGIPYGKSEPFEKPQEPDDWQDALNVTDFRERCFDVPTNGEEFPLPATENVLPFSHNCLFANVFAPYADDASTTLYPVMIFIHGGGFSWGSSIEYGKSGIENLLVSKGVVVVTFNYRLGPWGFLQYGKHAGNYGLWDQILLLKWVRTNIIKFHGNKDKITLFGESAGATSASLLSLSPISRDLFNNMILMSGTYSPRWLSKKEILQETSKFLFDNFSSPANDFSLKTISNDQIKNFSLDISSGMFKFGPNIDDLKLFPRPLDVLLKESPVKNVIMGTTHLESGLLLLPPVATLKTNMQITNAANYSMKDFVDLVTVLLSNQKDMNATTKGEILFRLLEKYNMIGETNSTIILQKVLQFKKVYRETLKRGSWWDKIRPRNEMKPTYNEARNRQKVGQKVWLYSFEYFNEHDFPSNHPLKDSFHMMELRYLFNFTVFGRRPWNEKDYKVANIFSNLWTNFAKSDSPTPLTQEFGLWSPWNEEERFQYFSINEIPKMEKDYHGFGESNSTNALI